MLLLILLILGTNLDNAIDLTRAKKYDEAILEFSKIENINIERLPELYFYRAVCEHQLLMKEECLKDLDLLDAQLNISKRFETMSLLLRADIVELKEDSLDEVSRLMNDAGRRLELGRAGTNLRQEQKEIVDKLDKLIEQIEKQQQQKQEQSQEKSQSSPAKEPIKGFERGPGNIDPKNFDKNFGWGNLPPKERQESIQKLTEQFPSHYRDIIEGYFKELAKNLNEEKE